MGQPVKIVDLAENLIRLMGKELGVDAEIVFTGLRPGEKLHEELVIEGEDVTRTSHPKVMKMIGNGALFPDLPGYLEELILLAQKGERQGVIRNLSMIVKGYTPDFAFHGFAVSQDRFAAEPPETGLKPTHPPGSTPSKSIH